MRTRPGWRRSIALAALATLGAVAGLASCFTRDTDALSSGWGTDADAPPDVLEDGAIAEIFAPEGCGAEGSACCDGGLCAVSLGCVGGACRKVDGGAPCGAEGQDCCGSACNAGLECASGRCAKIPDAAPPPCGDSGQPCCDGSACKGANVCAGATCVPCGGVGQPCCAGGACSGGGAVCSSAGCVACGGSGQLCCAGGSCGGGLVCKGSCVPCGGPMQPCCSSGGCAAPTACIGTTCEYCCALCNARTAYHRTGATSECTASATSYCASRGGLKDAMWGNCAP